MQTVHSFYLSELETLECSGLLILCVLLTGSVLTSDTNKAVHSQLDAGEQIVCEDSRLDVDQTAVIDSHSDC